MAHQSGGSDVNGSEPIRVLVVDDQELFRRGLTMLLAVEPDIEVVGEAGDGIEGTTLAETAAPDVVLLDVRMPKRSGIEACVSIKEAVPSAKIIMLTVSDEEADLYEAVKSGASGYLLKDSSIDEVAQAIRVVADGQSLISPSMAVKLIDEFKQMARPERATGAGPRLTDRELDVLKLVAKGHSNKEIA
ncbi:MAG: response regulator transcription factor, partial [Nocardioides sp.]